MLQQLTIENYTLIRRLSISFNPGFTVITGETGAGKSILIGALSLLLGQRADSNSLLDKNAKCVIEGVFYGRDYNLKSFFIENDLDFDDLIIIRREITPSGKSRAFINDTPVTLNLLRELGESLVDIHSQHAILSLNNAVFQLSIVDEYVGNASLLIQYKTVFHQLQEMRTELKKLLQSETQARKEQDYHKFLLNELEKADLKENEENELEEEVQVLEHAEEIKTNLLHVKHFLSNGDEDLLSKLSDSVNLLKKISSFHSDSNIVLQRLESVFIELKDIDMELTNMEESVNHDPERLDYISNRLSLIYQLESKHQVNSSKELIETRQELQEKLKNIDSLEDDIKKLEKQINEKQALLNKLTTQLNEKRNEAIKPVSRKLTGYLRELGMPDAQVNLIIERLKEAGPDGADRVRFYFNANKGGSLKEVSSIASGGELSRLMLSVKYLLSERKKLPTMVFDEIDVGISGEIAAKMGAMMLKMANSMQLLTITHLPQIAGKARSHMMVYKESGKHSTQSNIKLLNQEERIWEIAKMLSDENVSEVSLMKAKELLK